MNPIKNKELAALAISITTTLLVYISIPRGTTILLAHGILLLCTTLYTWSILSFLLGNSKSLNPTPHSWTYLNKTLEIVSLFAISSTTLCLITNVQSPYDFFKLCIPMGLLLIAKTTAEKIGAAPSANNPNPTWTQCSPKSSHKFSIPIAVNIVQRNLGPGLLLLYCLWIATANCLNLQTTNLQVPYYLSLSFIALGLASILPNQTSRKTMVYTMVFTIAISSFQKNTGFFSLPMLVVYKNFLAIIGLLAFSMLLTFKNEENHQKTCNPQNYKARNTTTILLVITGVCLLINPSTLGIGGLIILCSITLWLKIPDILEKRTELTNQTPQTPQTHRPIPRFLRKKSLEVTNMIIPPILAAIAIIVLLPNTEKISLLLNKEENLNGRIDIWATSINWIKINPVFGNGPNFWFEKGAISTQNMGTQGHKERAYNCLLDPSVQSGIPATLLICLALFLSLRNTNINYKSRYLLSTGLFLTLLTETHSFLGTPPHAGDAMLVTWLSLVWSQTSPPADLKKLEERASRAN